jgi:hypothetical protein
MTFKPWSSKVKGHLGVKFKVPDVKVMLKLRESFGAIPNVLAL